MLIRQAQDEMSDYASTFLLAIENSEPPVSSTRWGIWLCHTEVARTLVLDPNTVLYYCATIVQATNVQGFLL
jgi:hypothetical protein